MSFKLFSLALAGVVALSASTVAAGISKRAVSFTLYAYGDNIGGYPLVYRDNVAYAKAPEAVVTGYTNITFTLNSSNSSLSIAPSNGSTWSNQSLLFGFDTKNETDGGAPLVFESVSSSSTFEDTNWFFYGNTLVRKTSSGLVSEFYASESSTEGVLGLTWNTETTTSGTAVALRRVAPSS